MKAEFMDTNDAAAQLAALEASLRGAEAEEVAAEEQTAEDLLGDLELLNTASEVVTDDSLAELESKVLRDELYATQETATSIDTAVVESGDVKVAAPKAKTKRAAKAAGAAPVVRDMTALPDAVFQRLTTEADLTKARAKTMAARPTQVKIAEKFDNLFQSLHAGREPSRYVVIAFKLLRSTGVMKSADLIATMKAEGLGDGTARSQTGQIMALFAAVEIADRTGQTLVARKESAIAEKLAKIIK